MIAAETFLTAASARGVSFYTGVPCSFLTPFINAAINSSQCDYIGATSEGEAVGIAAGAYLAGRLPVVMCQNSGLGNLVNPLTSLNHPFRIPALLIVTWRGQPGLPDEPQHTLMGEITHRLLETMQIPHRPFPKVEADVVPALEDAVTTMAATGRPFALIMEKDSVADTALQPPPPRSAALTEWHDLSTGAVRATRADILEWIFHQFPGDPIIATTGKTGRELFTIGDRDNHLYLVGSMGCASGVGLGLSHVTGHRTVVIDGDGAALMKLGSLATIGAYAPPGLLHILLDNGVHDSTGGQSTVSATIDFAGIAKACRYATATCVTDPDGLDAALDRIGTRPGPHFLHVRIQPGSMAGLARPSVAPEDVARRFQAFVTGGQ